MALHCVSNPNGLTFHTVSTLLPSLCITLHGASNPNAYNISMVHRTWKKFNQTRPSSKKKLFFHVPSIHFFFMSGTWDFEKTRSALEPGETPKSDDAVKINLKYTSAYIIIK